MVEKVTLVVPEAPIPSAGPVAVHRKIPAGGVRLGVLDNSKGNADHLLRFLVAGVKELVPVASVVALSKSASSQPAPAHVLDQFVAEADFVVTAMAD